MSEYSYVDYFRFTVIWASKLAVIAAAAFFFYIFFGTSVTVRGNSMKDTLTDQDTILINTLDYRLGEPERFDCISFIYDDTYMVKRIIGLPGETVYISDGSIYIDGEKLECQYISEISGDMDAEVTVPSGEYFVLGDNPSFSEDSRYSEFGTVPLDSIIGKVWFCIYPIPDLKFIK